MSRARKLFKSQAEGGYHLWRVTLTRTVKPGSPPELNVQCGGHSVAETVQLLKNAVILLERQLAQAAPEPEPVGGPPNEYADASQTDASQTDASHAET